jgi:hypothetical protein
MTTKQYLNQRILPYGLKEFVRNIPTLSERQSLILVRRDFELIDLADLSDEVGLSPQRVLQIYTKARNKARRYFERIKSIEDNFEAQIKTETRLRYEVSELKIQLIKQLKPVPTIDEIDATEIDDLNLSVRLYNSLKANKIHNVGSIRKLAFHEPFQFRGFGKKSFNELVERLDEIGVKWPTK